MASVFVTNVLLDGIIRDLQIHVEIIRVWSQLGWPLYYTKTEKLFRFQME